MLENISTYIGIVIMMLGVFIGARIILNEEFKISKIMIIEVLLITSIIYQLIFTYLDGTIKTILICILNVFTFKYLFKIEYSKSIFLTVIYIVLLLIPETLFLSISTFILKLDKTLVYNVISGEIFGNIIICILFLIIILALKQPLRRLINLKIENKVKILFSGILTLACVLIVFYNAFNDLKFSYNLVISILTMIIFVGILLSLIKQTVEYNNLNKRYENILEFMTNYEEEVEKQRVLRHETKNAFISIKSKITDKMAGKEIIKYIDSVLEDDTKMNNEEYAKFKNLPPNGIKGLCYYKVQEAINKGLKVSTSISNRLSKSKLFKLNTKEMKDLAKLLGIYLDNAIEASAESEEKGIGLEVYPIKDSVKIIISNSYKYNVDLSKVGNTKYTTKGKNRGHGLLLAKNIINNNNIFTLENEITDKLFVQKITINNK